MVITPFSRPRASTTGIATRSYWSKVLITVSIESLSWRITGLGSMTYRISLMEGLVITVLVGRMPIRRFRSSTT